MRKRGLASPDSADALALTFAYPVAPSDHLRALSSRAGHVSEYDPFESMFRRRGSDQPRATHRNDFDPWVGNTPTEAMMHAPALTLRPERVPRTVRWLDKVVAVPSVTRRSEAIRLADAHCRAELAPYQKEAILRSHGVLELFSKLTHLKAEAKDVVVVLGRAPTPPEGLRITRAAATREEAEEIERARPVGGFYNKWSPC